MAEGTDFDEVRTIERMIDDLARKLAGLSADDPRRLKLTERIRALTDEIAARRGERCPNS